MGWLEVLLLDALKTPVPALPGGVREVGRSASRGSAESEVPAWDCPSQYNQHV